MFIRALIVAHRWIGVALCVLFLLWFPSGIGMMYWGMPSVTARDRLERSPALDPASVRLSPQEAAEKAGIDTVPAQVRLNSYDGRPVYRMGGEVVYADTGDVQGTATRALRHRAASQWTGLPITDATIVQVTEIDQWMVGNQLRNLRPLWKYSWPDGQQVYVGESGEVLMHTTTASRIKAYLSAVPHWLYFTPLRKHQPVWIRVATYTAMIGTGGAVVGVVLGLWLYSPKRKKYRHAGAPSSVPYRGQKRWHTILGLVFGLATITWTLSGSLAFFPFPAPERPRPPAQTQVQQAQQGQRQRGQGPRNQRGGDSGPAGALRGRTRFADFTTHPRDLLATRADLFIKELEFTSFDGQPLFKANFADGSSQLLSLDGAAINGFDEARIREIVAATVPKREALEFRTVTQYDYYYLDRTRQKPLPVILALTHDEAGTRYYVDPKTGTVAGTFDDRRWARRFFYNGLHSLSFPWLYNYRPLWDIVVITFMVGGTALCVTSLVLAWRVLGRRLRGLAVKKRPAPATATQAA